jgi:hypothetical protein
MCLRFHTWACTVGQQRRIGHPAVSDVRIRATISARSCSLSQAVNKIIRVDHAIKMVARHVCNAKKQKAPYVPEADARNQMQLA